MTEEERDSRLLRERARLAGLIHERYPDLGFELIPHTIRVAGSEDRVAATVIYRQGGTEYDSCGVPDELLLERGAAFYVDEIGELFRPSFASFMRQETGLR